MADEKPILFNGEMVRAILDGRKTETRRVVKKFHEDGTPAGSVHPDGAGTGWIGWFPGPVSAEKTVEVYPGEAGVRCPFGKPGDLLWVRETHAVRIEGGYEAEDTEYGEYFESEQVMYRASPRLGLRKWTTTPCIGQEAPHGITYLHPTTPLDRGPAHHVERWAPSIFMPKWAARIWIRVESVSVERVQDIDEAGAIAEGITHAPEQAAIGDSPADVFAELWDSINAKRGYPWESNPWVWVVKFEVVSTTGRPS